MPLLGPRHDHRRAIGRGRRAVGGVDRRHVVSVDRERVPPVRLRAGDEDVRIPAMHRRAALAEPVQVEHARQVGDVVVRSGLHRLPDRSFGRLGVPDQDPDPGRALVQAHPERHPQPDRRSLAERSGGGLDPRQLGDRGRVSLDRRSEPPQGQQHVIVDRADRLQHGVEQRRGVTLRQHETVVRRRMRVGEVGPQVIGEQDRGQMRRGHRRGGMTGPGRGRGSDAVDGQLGGELVPEPRAIVGPGPVAHAVPLLPLGVPTRARGARRRETTGTARGVAAGGTLDGGGAPPR